MASEVELSDLTSPRTAGGDTKASGESQDVVLSRGGESKRGGKFSRTVIKATNAIDLAHLSLEAEVNSRLDAKSRPAASYFKQFKIDWSDMPGTGNDLDSIPWVVAESVRASQNRNIRTSVRVRDLHYGGRTLGMNIHHPFRKFCIDVVEHPIFEKLILALIVLNCVVIAFESEQSESRVGGWESITQTVCTVLFFIELIMKVIAMGFMLNGKGSYLRNPWNIIDFLAVLFGFLLFLPTFGSNLTVIRSVRVLRPLRTVSSSQGMRMMVLSLVSSLPRLSNVFLLLIFAFFIFGIVGMQAFGGLFRRRCYDPSTNFFYSDDMCGPYDVCNGNQTCSDSGANPNRGATGFDNFAQACLTILAVPLAVVAVTLVLLNRIARLHFVIIRRVALNVLHLALPGIGADPLGLKVREQNTEKQREEQVVAKCVERHKVKGRVPPDARHRVVQNRVPVLATNDLEDGDHRPPEIVKVGARPLAVLIIQLVLEKLDPQERKHKHKEHEQEAKVGERPERLGDRVEQAVELSPVFGETEYPQQPKRSES